MFVNNFNILGIVRISQKVKGVLMGSLCDTVFCKMYILQDFHICISINIGYIQLEI